MLGMFLTKSRVFDLKTSGPGQTDMVQILGIFRAKISVFDLKNGFDYVKTSRKPDIIEIQVISAAAVHLLCKYFHSESAQRERAQILDPFWAKVSVFDVKTCFKFETAYFI